MRVAADPRKADAVRPSYSVHDTADALGCHFTTVYKLIDRGELEGYYLGRRVRVFIDSVRDYQTNRPTGATKTARDKAIERAKRATNPWRDVRHREAMAALRKMGVL